MNIRVLLADDHRMLLEALRSLLEREQDIAVVGEAHDGLAVFPLVRQEAPDVVVMDIGMPGLNGVEATRRLKVEHPEVKVVALSTYSDSQFVMEMLNAGARGYVTKDAVGAELLRALRAIVQGQVYLCPEALSATVESSIHGERRPGMQLGRRERQVLQLLAEGKSSPAIARQLHIAPSTVDVHRRNIMRKLDLHNVADLTKYALRQGLTSLLNKSG